MASLLSEFNRAFRATPKQKWRSSLGLSYYKGPRPRAERRGPLVPPTPAMVDPLGLLGHPARGRRR